MLTSILAAVFFLIGLIMGASASLMLFRLDSRFAKSLSSSGFFGLSYYTLNYFCDAFNVGEESKVFAYLILLVSAITGFFCACVYFSRLIKSQKALYGIELVDVLIGSKKSIELHYKSKESEIRAQYADREKKLVEQEELIKSKLKEIEQEKSDLCAEKERLDALSDDIASCLDKKHKISIPKSFRFPVRTGFFDLLPRYIKSVSQFEHHLNQFTDDFIACHAEGNYADKSDIEKLKAYLSGVSLYVGEFLFNWRSVRVHFRKLNLKEKVYEKLVAHNGPGTDSSDSDPITSIPIETGLIALASETKRSVVYSANAKSGYDTGSGHIWKDYVTMVFEQFCFSGYPVLSLGVSVKHKEDHREMLYFLSYIQIEQIIQENLKKVDKKIRIIDALTKELT